MTLTEFGMSRKNQGIFLEFEMFFKDRFEINIKMKWVLFQEVFSTGRDAIFKGK